MNENYETKKNKVTVQSSLSFCSEGTNYVTLGSTLTH